MKQATWTDERRQAASERMKLIKQGAYTPKGARVGQIRQHLGDADVRLILALGDERTRLVERRAAIELERQEINKQLAWLTNEAIAEKFDVGITYIRHLFKGTRQGRL